MAEGVKQAELHRHIRTAYVWTIAGNVIKYAVGLVISVLLARFLEPRDYGLIGMVTVFVTILSSLQDMGFGPAIVHFRENDSVLPTYFTTTMLLGITLTLVGVIGAPLVADFYHEPRLTLILRILSITLLISSFLSVSEGVLSKNFRFRELTLAQMVGTMVAGVIAVVMAATGFGVWSLVTNLVLSAALQATLLCRPVRPRFTLSPDKAALRRATRFGLPLSAATMLHRFYDNADYLVVGRLAGAVPLGYYTLAFRLATMPHEKIAVIINKVAFPSFAAMQDQPKKVVAHWFTLSRVVSLINFPLLLMLFVNARDLMLVVFGAKWLPAVMPIRFLCLVGALRSLVHIVLHIFNAMGNTRARLQFGVVNAVLLPVSFLVGVKWAGLKGVGMAWCIVYPVIWIYVLVKVRAILPFSYFKYFANLKMPFLIMVGCLVAMLPAEMIHHSDIIRLFVRSALGATAFALFLLTRKGVRNELLNLKGLASRNQA